MKISLSDWQNIGYLIKMMTCIMGTINTMFFLIYIHLIYELIHFITFQETVGIV